MCLDLDARKDEKCTKYQPPPTNKEQYCGFNSKLVSE